MKLTLNVIGILALSLSANIAQAQLLDISFSRITSNSTLDISSQLGATVLDKNQAQADYNSFSLINNMRDDEVLFTFTNNIGTESSISEIYFDDGTIFSQTGLINSMTGTTGFSGGMIKPGNLPGGKKIDPKFEATAGFGLDSQGSNGVNSSDDMVGIIIQLKSGIGFYQLLESLNDTTLRLGLHVRSIDGSKSDSFINSIITQAQLDTAAAEISAVPIPAAAWLFGPALFAVAGSIRRKKSI